MVIAHVLNICLIFFLVYIIAYSNPLGKSGIVLTLIFVISVNGGFKIVFTLLGVLVDKCKKMWKAHKY